MLLGRKFHVIDEITIPAIYLFKTLHTWTLNTAALHSESIGKFSHISLSYFTFTYRTFKLWFTGSADSSWHLRSPQFYQLQSSFFCTTYVPQIHSTNPLNYCPRFCLINLLFPFSFIEEHRRGYQIRHTELSSLGHSVSDSYLFTVLEISHVQCGQELGY